MKLINGIPLLGFGTWQLKGNDAKSAVSTALSVGYRHIDTADTYGNHREVGAAIQESGIERQEIFLTTKVWYDKLGKDDVISSGKRFLNELQTNYIDLLLIHWPNKNIPMEETFAGLQTLKDEGVIKNFGVSNFTTKHLEKALQITDGIIDNQVEFHPSFNQAALKSFCDEHTIALTAYSPIAQGQDLTLPLVRQLAAKYQRSFSQIIINWLMSKNIVVIPRSADHVHIQDNFKATEFQLYPEEIERLDSLNTNNRLIKPTFNEFDE